MAKELIEFANARPYKSDDGKLLDARIFVPRSKVNKIMLNALGDTFISLGDDDYAVVAESLDETVAKYEAACGQKD